VLRDIKAITVNRPRVACSLAVSVARASRRRHNTFVSWQSCEIFLMQLLMYSIDLNFAVIEFLGHAEVLNELVSFLFGKFRWHFTQDFYLILYVRT
jgi:hypothetical protein